MLKLLKKIPYSILLPVALILGLSPFVPEPHLFEKIRLLVAGQLVRPIDIFDLLLHSSPLFLILLKAIVSKK